MALRKKARKFLNIKIYF